MWKTGLFEVDTVLLYSVLMSCRVFLAIGSEVFYAMFYGPVADAELKEVPIPNYRKETFQALVDYLYTDTVSGGVSVEAADLDRNFGILKCALQYGVPGLALICRQAIFDTLQTDVATACAVLIEVGGLPLLAPLYTVYKGLLVCRRENWKKTSSSKRPCACLMHTRRRTWTISKRLTGNC